MTRLITSQGVSVLDGKRGCDPSTGLGSQRQSVRLRDPGTSS